MKINENLKRVLTVVWRFLTNNILMKLSSVLIAVVMWSYVIYANPSITRDKTLSGVDVVVSGQSVLTSRALALLTDISEIPAVRVRVTAPQASYTLLDNDSVRVEMDLTFIRQTGKQRIALRGTSSYGKVVQIWPEYIDLEVEELDQRYVPINVELTGEVRDDYWYNITRTNPSQMTVSGPASVVRRVTSARVQLDVTGNTASHSRAEQFVLLDAQGEEITASGLSRSTSSVTVGIDIYPSKSIALSTDPDDILTGELPDGYMVESVEIQPESITVAAEESLLEGLNEFTLEPVDLTEARRTITAVRGITRIKDIKFLSSEQVTVTVNIAEQTVSRLIEGVPLKVVGGTSEARTVDVTVTGPYSAVNELRAGDLEAVAEAGGLPAGEQEIGVRATALEYPELLCAAEPATVRVVAGE